MTAIFNREKADEAIDKVKSHKHYKYLRTQWNYSRDNAFACTAMHVCTDKYELSLTLNTYAQRNRRIKKV